MLIPYHNIDPEIKSLVRVLNDSEVIRTLGCCTGHGYEKVASIIFYVVDLDKWINLLKYLLFLNTQLKDVNIEVIQRHRLDPEMKYCVNWELVIEVHPRNKEINEPELTRIRKAKDLAFQKLEENIKRWVEGFPLYPASLII